MAGFRPLACVLFSLVVFMATGCVSPPKVDLYQKAIDDGNHSICLTLKGQNSRDSCLQKVGVSRGSPLVCQLIESQSYSRVCFEGVLSASKNASVCGGISNASIADQCRWAAAKVLLNSTMCETLQGRQERLLCLQDLRNIRAF